MLLLLLLFLLLLSSSLLLRFLLLLLYNLRAKQALEKQQDVSRRVTEENLRLRQQLADAANRLQVKKSSTKHFFSFNRGRVWLGRKDRGFLKIGERGWTSFWNSDVLTGIAPVFLKEFYFKRRHKGILKFRTTNRNEMYNLEKRKKKNGLWRNFWQIWKIDVLVLRLLVLIKNPNWEMALAWIPGTILFDLLFICAWEHQNLSLSSPPSFQILENEKVSTQQDHDLFRRQLKVSAW